MKTSLFPLDPILIVDDEANILRGFKTGLGSAGINNLLLCSDAREVMPLLSTNKVEVILLDLSMPFISGEDLLLLIANEFPEIPVIIITGKNKVDTIVRCMKTGAFDFLVKPVKKDRLVSTIDKAIKVRGLEKENRLLKERILSRSLEYPGVFSDIITNNRIMFGLFQYIESISQSVQPVLITGETGVGKELMAKAVHTLSLRQGPLITVNAAGLDDNIFSDTLFGHIKGAFTGAQGIRQGLVERASGGSLFLDEIGDLSLHSQVKLLRLLQEREYFPIGADLPKKADVRIIAATNLDIQALYDSGAFRKDLYYRLCTHRVHIPPLCERLDDLPLLVDHFFKTTAQALGKKKPSPPPELMTLLSNYHFPGNIRELKTIIHDAVSMHQSKVLSLDRFSAHIYKNQSNAKTTLQQEPHKKDNSWFTGFEQIPTLEQATMALIGEAMKRSDSNQSMAARFLGISRQRLARLLKSNSR